MIRLGFLVGTLLAAFNTNAHHAATGLYDRNVIGEVEGEISSIFWRNPHVRFGITRTGENGEEEYWEVEFGSVNTLERIGVSPDLVQVGDRVTGSGSLGRRGLKALFADSITLSNGEQVPFNASVDRRYGLTENAAVPAIGGLVADPRTDIFRVWIPSQRPNTGAGTTQFPLTQAGRAAKDAWDPADDAALRCIPPGLPTAMDNPYPIELLQQGDAIVLLLEEWDGVRTIHMTDEDDGSWRTHSRMGHSVGHWEGNSLLVETTDIGWRYIDDLGTPQSEDVVIAERFTLSSDGGRLAWVARITDPENFTEPVVMEAEWTWVPGHEIKPFNCALPE